jgi:hypothetical protein
MTSIMGMHIEKQQKRQFTLTAQVYYSGHTRAVTKAATSLSQLQATDGMSVHRSDEMGLRRNDAVKEKQNSGGRLPGWLPTLSNY